MSKSNNILLVVMFICCLTMFSYYPFLVTYLNSSTSIGTKNVGLLMMFGIISGSLLSLFSLLTFKVKDQSIGLIFALVMFSIALVIMGIITTIDLYLVVLIGVTLSIFVYRYAIGLYFTYSRSLQINSLDTPDQKSLLFTRIKLVNSLGGALGPLIGQLIINTHGHQYLFFITSSSFALCALIVLICRLSISPRVLVAPIVKEAQQTQRRFTALIATELKNDSKFRYLTLGAMLHFTFEAQLYTFISLNIEKSGISNGVALIFSFNAIALITIAILAGCMIKKNTSFGRSRHLIVFGSTLSCLSIILAPQATSMGWLVLIVILFSIGEFITPQTCVDLITDSEKPITQRLAVYNFFTSSVGMGVGFFIGGALFSQANTMLSIVVWTIILIGIAICFYTSESDQARVEVKH